LKILFYFEKKLFFFKKAQVIIKKNLLLSFKIFPSKRCKKVTITFYHYIFDSINHL